MKFMIIAALLAVAYAAPQLGGRQQASTTPVPILSQESELNPDGSYRFSFKTGDGVSREESGAQKQITPEDAGTVSRGSYTYTAPDGSTITVSFVADENGFQPKGAHLPTPPPMPEHVVKLLDDLRRAGKL